MSKLFFISALFAVAFAVHAQVVSPTHSPGAHQKTVHFDDSSTATLILTARGEGVQIYTCTKDADWVWKLKGPEATLFDDKHQSIGKHFAGPTWHLDDGSEVQGKVLESQDQPRTLPWLILSAVATGGKGRLSHVDAVRRSDTLGGLAPPKGCDEQHAGTELRVPYTATYSFYDKKD